MSELRTPAGGAPPADEVSEHVQQTGKQANLGWVTRSLIRPRLKTRQAILTREPKKETVKAETGPAPATESGVG